MATFSQGDLVQVTRSVEVDPGVIVAGARNRVYGIAPTWAPGGSTNKSGINRGDGGVHSVRAGLRTASATVPSELVFLLNHLEHEDFFRQEFPASEVSVVDVDVTFAHAGAQLPVNEGGLGGTGPILTAAAGAFNDIYNADHQGCMLEITGAAADPDNRWPRAIYAAKSDGTQIDLMPEYVSGVAGAFGSPLINEGPVQVTLRIGKPIKNQGVQAIRYVNFEYEFTDQQNGGNSSFENVVGAKAVSWKMGLDGKGNMTTEIGYECMDYAIPYEATVGNGTVTPNPGVDNDVMTSAEDLAYFVVNGALMLQADNLVSWNVDANGNGQGIDNTAGSRSRTGVTVGDIDFTGSMKLYHEHTKLKQIATYAHAGTRVPQAMKVQDPFGNWYWFHQPRTLFAPGGPIPGAKGSLVEADFTYETMLGPGSMRTGILQAFAASP